MPRPTFVAEHIREMEQRPFDGLLMRVPEIGIFEPTRHEIPAAELAALEAIEWDRFTDNFLMMYAASKMDWFSDTDWEAVVHNVRQVSRAAQAGRCVGVCFDCEPYGANPWHYPTQPHADEYPSLSSRPRCVGEAHSSWTRSRPRWTRRSSTPSS